MHHLSHALSGVLLVGAALVSGCARDEAASPADAPSTHLHDEMPSEPTALHSDAYAMTFALSPAPTAGQPAEIRYTPRTAEGALMTDLTVNHEALTHLVVVSRDLATFDHVHPEHQPDGSFVLPYTFPAGGEYVLFADYLPAGASEAQVFAHAVRVGGEAPPIRPLGAATAEATEEGLTAHLDTGGPLRAGRVATLAFHVADSDGDVADLEPYLGDGGHVVVIPEGAEGYLHVHPQDQAHGGHGHGPAAHATAEAYGPMLRFATTFPSAGRYKLWLQVQQAGRVHTLPFVLDVA